MHAGNNVPSHVCSNALQKCKNRGITMVFLAHGISYDVVLTHGISYDVVLAHGIDKG